MPQPQARRWVFTLNNPEGELDREWPKLRYASWQLERGEEGTLHWQGYVELNASVKLGGMKAWLPRAHFEVARADRVTARAYTRKEDTRVDGPWEFGDFGSGGQGKRTDIELAAAHVDDHGLAGLAEAHPAAFIKYNRGLREYARAIEKPVRDEGFQPRPWQSKVLSRLAEEPDDRHIFWVADSIGNRGKSRLSKHLCCEHGAIQLTGRVVDMAYAYNKERVVIFDITRAQAEHSDHIYSFAECLKNGYIFSSKYESAAKRFRPPHVIVFANVFPKDGMWSADRAIVMDLNNPDMHV